MKAYKNILELIGKTPLVKINKLTRDCEAEVFVKLECFNPSSSVKDRAALNMIEHAERLFFIEPGKSTIVEPTSVNTGIALAMICALKGYRLILTMPSSVSVERRRLMKAYGAEIILTDPALGRQGAVNKAVELSKTIPDVFIPNQFKNPANPEIHEKTTAREIWDDTDGKVDIVISGIGTGGTLMGIAKELKSKKPLLETVAVEPYESSVLTGHPKGPHGIQGIGPGFIPAIVNLDYFDTIMRVHTTTAIGMARKLAKKEGILCGISGGAALAAAIELAKEEQNKGKLIVCILPDNGERYLNTELFHEDSNK